MLADRCAACPDGQVATRRHVVPAADVVAAAADPVTFSSAASAHRMVPNSLDPPEHTAFRAVIDPYFTAERMAALEPRIRQVAHDVVGRLPRGTTVDAVTGMSYPYDRDTRRTR